MSGAAAGRPVERSGTASRDALPQAWESLWGAPVDPLRLELRRFQREFAALAAEVELIEMRETFGGLVGSEELRSHPVHRWFTYKEGFSPSLLGAVIEQLGGVGPLRVVDTFGGVATTALSGLTDERVEEVRSLEYSPWARFAGQTKLSWPDLRAARLTDLVPSALNYNSDSSIPFPGLSSFANPRVFDRATVRSLLSARDHLRRLDGATQLERDFFLLGLGAVVEDLSRVMKDGRALRVRGQRKRRRSSLVEGDPPESADRVHWFLAHQWRAMISDLEAVASCASTARRTPAVHVAGDARALDAVRLPSGDEAFPCDWADISLFSPPYLNCIDYSELYKLELWLMEHIATQDEFREVRRGTLRSHPSIKFPPRASLEAVREEPAVRLVYDLSDWLCRNGTRRDVGPVVQAYFEDMFEVWQQQFRVLAPNGAAVCVVANSTFAKRARLPDGTRSEHWRLPLLTDVLLAHLARLAGFERVEIWDARALRPRNVSAGAARESLVVARRAP